VVATVLASVAATALGSARAKRVRGPGPCRRSCPGKAEREVFTRELAREDEVESKRFFMGIPHREVTEPETSG
jgi:hypothetical protein